MSNLKSKRFLWDGADFPCLISISIETTLKFEITKDKSVGRHNQWDPQHNSSDFWFYGIFFVSGHSTEPEAVIALAGILSQKTLATKKGRIVLAGDPKQLGPILR